MQDSIQSKEKKILPESCNPERGHTVSTLIDLNMKKPLKFQWLFIEQLRWYQ
jgi:hypothetical protein